MHMELLLTALYSRTSCPPSSVAARRDGRRSKRREPEGGGGTTSADWEGPQSTAAAK